MLHTYKHDKQQVFDQVFKPSIDQVFAKYWPSIYKAFTSIDQVQVLTKHLPSIDQALTKNVFSQVLKAYKLFQKPENACFAGIF